ncbi:hypothetical protein [Modicisalibacter luteus]|uniref:Uncharacterized protein n=1 Tax=Modicisalibacter luteus TaxID=453962 RepID=A0ABV7M2I4_9GAMM|nr:hypothetical protein [Halomonas lutea]GHB09640.1 hypothetical protein GCM10007159_34770 [Halomonas lutea]
MERGKLSLLATLLLSGALLAGCGDDEEATSTDTTNPASENAGESGGETANREMDVGEGSAETQVDVGNDADVATGLTGTTSGITGSDMVEPDETIGEGQSSRDQMPVSDPAAQQMQPNESTPEEPAQGNSSSGGGQNGVSQASSSSTSQDAQE